MANFFPRREFGNTPVVHPFEEVLIMDSEIVLFRSLCYNKSICSTYLSFRHS
jgi:hypothetical protein